MSHACCKRSRNRDTIYIYGVVVYANEEERGYEGTGHLSARL